MDSNPKQCPSRPKADNLVDDQKDAAASLGASCGASSSATGGPTGNEAGGSRQPSSTSCGMEEMTSPSPAAVAESRVVGASSSSSSSSSSPSQSVGVGGESHTATARTTADDLALALRGSPSQCVMKLTPDKHSNSGSNNSGTSTASTNPPSVPGCSQMSGAGGGGGSSASPTSDLKKKEKKKEATTTATTASASAACKEPQTTSKGTKRSHDEVEPEEAASPAPVKQKNKKRCYKCSCKLVLAQREIGRCRCELVFCPLHRLPEQHSCEFDHKEEGRQLAREKMVKPTRHLGNSCRRLDNNS